MPTFQITYPLSVHKEKKGLRGVLPSPHIGDPSWIDRLPSHLKIPPNGTDIPVYPAFFGGIGLGFTGAPELVHLSDPDNPSAGKIVRKEYTHETTHTDLDLFKVLNDTHSQILKYIRFWVNGGVHISYRLTDRSTFKVYIRGHDEQKTTDAIDKWTDILNKFEWSNNDYNYFIVPEHFAQRKKKELQRQVNSDW